MLSSLILSVDRLCISYIADFSKMIQMFNMRLNHIKHGAGLGGNTSALTNLLDRLFLTPDM